MGTGRSIGILLFDGVELLDFAGPLEVFSVARKYGGAELSAFTIGVLPGGAPIACAAGLQVLPDFDLGSAPHTDIVVVPGGKGTRREMLNERLIAWLVDRRGRAEITASVCTGALVLAEAGLLDGRRATTHHSVIEMLKGYGNIRVVEGSRYVDEGAIVTSGGISAGIDMALHLVKRLYGDGAAKAAIDEMEWRGAEA